MSTGVYANGSAVACKAGDGKVIAAFPDVCLSPPSPPAGPIPVPYPNTSFSKDMKDGSKTVKIKGKEVMLKDSSYFKSSPLGDEAATRSFGANIVSHSITGKTYFRSWSMDVKFEGLNVDRHLDLTTSNHASEGPGEGVPTPDGEESSHGSDDSIPKCPCCDKKAHSQAQIDALNGTQTDRGPMTAEEWYSPVPAAGAPPQFATEARELFAEIRAGKCKNLLPPAEPGAKTKDCYSHYVTDQRQPAREKTKIENEWNAYKPKYMARNKLRNNENVGHRTAKTAGGCPTGPGNLMVVPPDCQPYEDKLADLQNRASSWHRRRLGLV